MRTDKLMKIKVGDCVERTIFGGTTMVLKVTRLTKTRIYCGSWKFDRLTGNEIDDTMDILIGYIRPVEELIQKTMDAPGCDFPRRNDTPKGK